MRYYELLTENTVDRMAPAVALGLHAMTELPIVALMVGKNGHQRVAHVMVQSADDAFIDANGARSLVEIMNDAGVVPHEEKWEVRQISPELLLLWTNGKRLPVITKDAAHEAKLRATEIVGSLGLTAR